jgi:hypothetical protein
MKTEITATEIATTEPLARESALVNDYQGQLTVKPNISAFLTMMKASDYEALKASAAAIDPNATAITITAIYKEFAVGESIVGIFTGLDGITPKQTNELTGEVEKRHCDSVQFMANDGKLYQCAGVALVNQFVDSETGDFKIPVGQKVRITHTGKNNRTKLYEVGLIVD